MGVVTFETGAPSEIAPSRADVACFVGFVARREGVPVPQALVRWLDRRGFDADEALLDVPVPIDSWSLFDRLFAWDRRPIEGRTEVGHAYLGAAVRSFFAEGGRSCYVVRVGDPLPVPTRVRGTAPGTPRDPVAERAAAELLRSTQLEQISPALPLSIDAHAGDRGSWRGVDHLLGLPEVSFLCLPDLPDIIRGQDPDPVVIEDRTGAEHFTDCSTAQVTRSGLELGGSPPRADFEAYQVWTQVVHAIGDFLERQARTVQLVAALPMPVSGSAAEAGLTGLVEDLRTRGSGDAHETRERNSFLQVVFPWVRANASSALPGGVQPPDGVLLGVLARSALTRGAYLSAAGTPLHTVSAVDPQLPTEHLEVSAHTGDGSPRLIEMLSLVGRTPRGMALLSDVTLADDAPFRASSVRRLVSVIVRAARRLGESSVFDPSNEALWANIRRRMNSLMAELFRIGALAGETVDDAFSVRCDSTTMTQADLDAGRLIARVSFTAASPIERIVVVLSLTGPGASTPASPSPLVESGVGAV